MHVQHTTIDTWQHPLADALGSVRAMMTDKLTVVGSTDYTPYGTPDAPLAATDFHFTGEMRDANGLQYHRARYYHPQFGIFPSLDPFEGTTSRPMSLNGYSWVEGNPVMNVDPTGEIANPATLYSGAKVIMAAVAGVPMATVLSLLAAALAALAFTAAIAYVINQLTREDEKTCVPAIPQVEPIPELSDIDRINPEPTLPRTPVPYYFDQPDPNPQPATQTPVPTSTPTPTQEPQEIIRHFTREDLYQGIVSQNGRYIFDPSRTTDPRAVGGGAIYFGSTMPFDTLNQGLGFVVQNLYNYGDEYQNHRFHPYVIHTTYGMRNESDYVDLASNPDRWPKCFIDFDKQTVEEIAGELRERPHRTRGENEYVLYFESGVTSIDLTQAVIQSGPVSILDPSPPFPNVPYSACSEGSRRVNR